MIGVNRPDWRRIAIVARGVVGLKAVWLCTVFGAANEAVWLGPAALVIFAAVQLLLFVVSPPGGTGACMWPGDGSRPGDPSAKSRMDCLCSRVATSGPCARLNSGVVGRLCPNEHRRPGLAAREAPAGGFVRRNRRAVCILFGNRPGGRIRRRRGFLRAGGFVLCGGYAAVGGIGGVL